MIYHVVHGRCCCHLLTFWVWISVKLGVGKAGMTAPFASSREWSHPENESAHSCSLLRSVNRGQMSERPKHHGNVGRSLMHSFFRYRPKSIKRTHSSTVSVLSKSDHVIIARTPVCEAIGCVMHLKHWTRFLIDVANVGSDFGSYRNTCTALLCSF